MNRDKLWNKLLESEEVIEYEFTIGSGYIRVWLLTFGIICLPFVLFYGIGLALFAIAWFIVAYLGRLANAYALTDSRIVTHTGILSTQTTSIEYDQITDVTVDESLFQRLASRTGDIRINTAGSSRTEIVIDNISDPHSVAKKIKELRSKAAKNQKVLF